jgi:uncharacterized protein (DUF2141 family)
MRTALLLLTFLLVMMVAAAAQQAPATPAQGFTLTVVVEGVNQLGGNVGVLLFNSPKGWAEDRSVALKDIVVPAHEGTVNVVIPNLPAGDYALSIAHDVNQNHKLDRNWMSKPTEQWGISNNPHAIIKTPPYSSGRFTLSQNMEIHVKMQQ